MWERSFVILAVALLCSGECIQVGPRGYGRVEFSAFSSIGESIPNASFDLLEAGTQKSLRAQLHGGVAENLPYGTYLLRIQAQGFRSAQRQFLLDQPVVSVRVPLSVSVECGGFAEIGGTISAVEREHDLWVKVVPFFGTNGGETRVGVIGKSGVFLIAGLDDGMYYLLVIDGKAIIHTETVHIVGNNRIRIELGKP
jgi:hypothetical protein